MTPKLILRLLAAAILVAGLTFLAVQIGGRRPPPEATSSPQAGPGGPFTLVDTTGRPFTEAGLKGRWSIVFFGFTFCPDVCPTTLDTLGRTLDLLGPDGKKVQIIFVSVDPERDTPAQMAAYLNNPAFPPGVVGLTGTPEQVAAVARAYKVYYEKQGEGDAYLINHSSISYLMDPSGQFARVLPYGMAPEALAGQVRDAMKRG
ncbi:MAG: SCO family protein [Phenylobacterium sp.]|uniref:SCO family protein n=1 Tax=Phenylobacterium sp. TaxID=1871053 RepID=UPI0025E0C68C|nr:SCO family protein [Phenylobacterium sp.]MCA6223253.1 SCO family protein [Phenylobacterium sp.]MCA6226072.1 SCO family protein [Phenylobacterium sp.]MCA6232487.1 SCO family protein [Phenylobacterium sp.]MCA6234232.1 SCO family protein [Phenylobacterium sp.]MCA6249907.1 SCO family protein [Phenylobacterium sp.]